MSIVSEAVPLAAALLLLLIIIWILAEWVNVDD
jgi:hypothetical protein